MRREATSGIINDEKSAGTLPACGNVCFREVAGAFPHLCAQLAHPRPALESSQFMRDSKQVLPNMRSAEAGLFVGMVCTGAALFPHGSVLES